METVRSAHFWVFFVIWTLFSSVVALSASLLTLRLAKRWLATNLAPFWARPLFWAAGIRVRLVGLEHINDRAPRVMVMNHVSSLDNFLVCAMGPPGLCPMVKKEIAWLPIMGQVFWALGGVFVDRSNAERARASSDHLRDVMISEKLTAVIAPEGTRSKSGQLLPFKLGAFHIARRAGAEIVPFVIHGTFDLMRPGDWRIRSGEVVGEFREAIRIPEGADLRQVADELQAHYQQWLAAGPPPALAHQPS